MCMNKRIIPQILFKPVCAILEFILFLRDIGESNFHLTLDKYSVKLI